MSIINYMQRTFNLIKTIIPKISETELIALRSGTTSIDREIFQGKVNIPKNNHNKFTENENLFYQKTTSILDKYGNTSSFNHLNLHTLYHKN